MRRRRFSGATAVTIGVVTSCVGLYGGLWIAGNLIDSANIWPEGRRLLLVVPVIGFLGLVVGAMGAVISRTDLAAKITLGVVLLAGALTFAAGWGHSGWLTALVTFLVLASGVYLGGVTVARRWLLSESGSAQPESD